MHVHIINEWNVLSGPAEGTVSQEWRIARTHDRQWRKEKSTVLYYPRSTTEVQLYVPAVLEHSPWLSRRRDLFPTVGATEHVTIPRHVCIYIDGVCVRWMPDSMQRCHVWRLQSATSPCMTCGFSQRTPHCVRRCQIWLLQCSPVLWLQRCQTDGSNVVNSPV